MFSEISILLVAACTVTGALLLFLACKAVAFYRRKISNLEAIYQLVERSQDIIYHFEVKPDFGYKYLSPAIERVLGPNLMEESKTNPFLAFERVHPDDYPILLRKISGKLDYSKPIRLRWKNEQGTYIYFEEFVTPIYENGELTAIQGIIRNVDDKVTLQKELEYKATHDSLTGLFNRECFEADMQKCDQCEDIPVGLIICDLDNLKQINDRRGHKMGDRLLMETSDILRNISGDKVSVCRIGGDEFAILIENCTLQSLDDLVKVIQSSISMFNQSRHEFPISMSIGTAYMESSLGTMEELFRRADNEMYRQKQHHKKVRPSML
ncbi:sensor domain-containing diguanylate cyclase [Rossellomorea aquimaris]|uniref:sensor domain-containing diguanylate cyclase n=1 Tax=Rossellomorea aquimaris TaxID=189382 RepID=UPI001CD6959F|nr:sensor domain-containing diguanylate cyclase [Rossellomorea aquimaris]MCA1056557.1 sensor domain-containing diguanylate cyclase [Rossellomorea aquimaris]